MDQGYRCFCYLVDKNFDKEGDILEGEEIGSLTNQMSLGEKMREKEGRVERYMQLSRMIMSSILSDKKESNNPNSMVETALKKIIKVLIHAIMIIYSNSEAVKDFS